MTCREVRKDVGEFAVEISGSETVFFELMQTLGAHIAETEKCPQQGEEAAFARAAHVLVCAVKRRFVLAIAEAVT